MKTKTGKLVKKMIHDKINSIVEAWKNIRAILLVWINYSKKDKKHQCVIEKMINK